MAELLPISDVTVKKVQDAIRTAFLSDFDPNAVARFVASVDWSFFDPGAPSRASRALSQLSAWDTAFRGGELSFYDYVYRVRSLLPSDERRWPIRSDSSTAATTVQVASVIIGSAESRRSESADTQPLRASV